MAQQQAHYFAHAAQFASQRLIRGMQYGSAREQQCGETRVEAMEGDGFDQEREIVEARRKQREDMAAEGFVAGEQVVIQRRGTTTSVTAVSAIAAAVQSAWPSRQLLVSTQLFSGVTW
jgi:hypothetical protein